MNIRDDLAPIKSCVLFFSFAVKGIKVGDFRRGTKTFDTKTGNVLTLTGPNGLTTTWEYDALGRQAKETRADGTTTTTNA
jgi:YD repeat-containing protein